MRVQGVVAAIAVPAIVIGVIGLVVIQAEDSLSGRSHGAVESAAIAQPLDVSAPARTAPAADAAGAPAAVAPETKAAPQPRAVPARVTFAEYSALQRQILGAVDGWWTTALHRAGLSYTGPHITIAGRGKHAMSECGRAVAAPRDSKSAYPAFYCRGDRTVYLSSGWLYDAIYANFHRGGVAAIIAHEYGHHVQNLTGQNDKVLRGETGPQSGPVRLELQADCYAGVWTANAVKTDFIAIDDADIEEGLSAASAVGDDRIQEKAQGQVNPESWTHGSAEQRVKWFRVGLSSGDPNACDTFAVRTV